MDQRGVGSTRAGPDHNERWRRIVMAKSSVSQRRKSGIPVKDVLGERFGKLTVIERAPRTPASTNARWLCRCDCGKETFATGTSLRGGRTKSCGCVWVPPRKPRKP